MRRTTISRRTARAGAPLAALVWVAALAVPASADSATFTDARGDIVAGNDIWSVRVVNGADEGTRLRLVARLADLGPGDRVDFWIDTVPSDPGPEFRADAVANSDFLEVRAVDHWQQAGTAVTCPGLRVRMDGFDPTQQARFNIPLRCLGNPAAVRVAAHSRSVTENGAQNDWAPALRTWYRWVARSPIA